jgi:hypothetical protein
MNHRGIMSQKHPENHGNICVAAMVAVKTGRPSRWFPQPLEPTVEVGFLLRVYRKISNLRCSYRWMADAIPATPRSRRRRASRLERESDDRERQRRVPVSFLIVLAQH